MLPRTTSYFVLAVSLKSLQRKVEMKLCKYDSFLIWQKWTLCEERRTTRIVTLIHVVNAFPFHLGNFLVSTCDTKREPFKQQGTLGVYTISVKHDRGQGKLVKPEKQSKACGISSDSFWHAPNYKIRPKKKEGKSAQLPVYNISPGEGANLKLQWC